MADQNTEFLNKLLKEQYKQLTNTKQELENSLQYYQGLVEDFKKRIAQAASDIENIKATGIDLSEPEEVNTGGPTSDTEVSPNLDGSTTEQASTDTPAASTDTPAASNDTPAASESDSTADSNASAENTTENQNTTE